MSTLSAPLSAPTNVSSAPAPSGRSELINALSTFRTEFAVVGLFSGIANLMMLAPTMYMLQVFDRVLVSRSELTLLVVSAVVLFFIVIMALSEWLRSLVLVRVGVRIDAALSTRVFNACFDARLGKTSVMHERSFADLTEIRQFMTGNGVIAFFDAPWFPIYIAVMFLLHPLLGLLTIFFAVLQLGVAWWGHWQAVRPSEDMFDAQTEITQFLQGKLRNVEAIEAMGMGSGIKQRWQQRHDEYNRHHVRSHRINHRVTAWSKFLRFSQQSLGLGAGALLVIDGQLSPGAMIAANVLMTRALAPIDLMINTWRGFLGARQAFGRLERLLEQNPQRDQALQRQAPSGHISLEGVSAHAQGRAQPILEHIDLRFAPGKVTVILGPSGSGKSTLARVMVGLWEPSAGQVCFDGKPVSLWRREEIGPHLGYLPQDVQLFEGTIAENIARFDQVDSGRVIEAARICGLHEMILRLPKGYDTALAEVGGMLSGGQRQRVALARALYGQPAIVVLDEPNANLDDVGEQALTQAVHSLRQQGRTVVLISHRPTAIALADDLLLLRAGRIEMQGPREQVLAELQRRHAATQAAQATSTASASPAGSATPLTPQPPPANA